MRVGSREQLDFIDSSSGEMDCVYWQHLDEMDLCSTAEVIGSSSGETKGMKKHLRKIISEYESLDLDMPCTRKFQKPPAAQPLTICMECMPEKKISHEDIFNAINRVLPKAMEKERVLNILFENINVICGTAGRKNRWLIAVSDFETRNLFLNSGLVVKDEFFPLRCYDDVVMEEYKLQLQRAMARKKILDTLSGTADPDMLSSKK
ncbi:putative uncharacterized protein C19orf81 homolog [Protopterus annectens]|uniref:putative uncharacterized protein C19orf81 homolog n=1 Tax=Protopterus annectens TaxID=7888 RepID=UPI001CF9B588|nr:putative uncharacterized protein C19orf81 homolog [Protopterus annectens]